MAINELKGVVGYPIKLALSPSPANLDGEYIFALLFAGARKSIVKFVHKIAWLHQCINIASVS